MGNTAIIKSSRNNNKGVYLHWNGGRDSVEAFLKYCELRGFRSFEDDYGMARFVQVVSNFFDGGLSIGITDEPLAWETDNGIYEVEGWKIVSRKKYNRREQQEHDLMEMVKAIDEAQPTRQQLGDFITAEEVDTDTIEKGDKVYMQETNGTYKLYEVLGIKDGKPYVNKYDHDGDYTWNPNNYVGTKTVRRATK